MSLAVLNKNLDSAFLKICDVSHYMIKSSRVLNMVKKLDNAYDEIVNVSEIIISKYEKPPQPQPEKNILDSLTQNLKDSNQIGIIPTSMTPDLEIVVDHFKRAPLTNVKFEFQFQNPISFAKREAFISLVNPTVDVYSDDVMRNKRVSKIMSSIPSSGISNPIAAIMNFCRYNLKIDVKFLTIELGKNDREEDIFKIECWLLDDLLGEFTHTRRKYAKENCARAALYTLNDNEEIVKKYILRIL